MSEDFKVPPEVEEAIREVTGANLSRPPEMPTPTGKYPAPREFAGPVQPSPTAPAAPREAPPQFPGRPKGSDTIPAWLSKDEYVVNSDSARENLALLERINDAHGKIANRFSKGGTVPRPPDETDDFPRYLASGGSASRRNRRRRRARKYLEHQEDVDEDYPGESLWDPREQKRRGIAKREAGHETAGRMQQGYGSTLAAFQDPSELRGVGHGAEAAGHFLGFIPGAEEAGKFVKVVMDSTDKLKEWSNQLHDTNIQFAEFSGAMAGVKAQQEVREIELGMERGERRAKSAEFLASGKNELDRSTAPLEDAWGRIKSDVGGLLDRAFARTIGKYGLEPLGKAINAFLDLVEGESEEGMGVIQQGAEAYEKQYGKPKRF